MTPTEPFARVVTQKDDGGVLVLVGNISFGYFSEELADNFKKKISKVNAAFESACRDRVREALESAEKSCVDRANGWRSINVKAKTDYKRKASWDKSHEADECASSIHSLAGEILGEEKP